jgi:hypothetical protein
MKMKYLVMVSDLVQGKCTLTPLQEKKLLKMLTMAFGDYLKSVEHEEVVD